MAGEKIPQHLNNEEELEQMLIEEFSKPHYLMEEKKFLNVSL